LIFQTAIPPANCAAAYTALGIIEQSKEKRQQLISHVLQIKNVKEMGFLVKGADTPIIPVIVGDTQKDCNICKKAAGKRNICTCYPSTN